MFLNFTALILKFRGLTAHQLKWILECCFVFWEDAPGNGNCEQKTGRKGQALWALSPVSLFIVDTGVNWK